MANRDLLYTRHPTRAQVAQLVEQRIENPRVTGSIPVLGTIFHLTNRNRKQLAWALAVPSYLAWMRRQPPFRSLRSFASRISAGSWKAMVPVKPPLASIRKMDAVWSMV
jgi:hypothetical protein